MNKKHGHGETKKDMKREASESSPRMEQEYRSGQLSDDVDMTADDDMSMDRSEAKKDMEKQNA